MFLFVVVNKGENMHPCEPSIDELKKMYREMMAEKSTDDNMKKISVLDKQIKRLEAEGKLQKKEEKAVEKVEEKIVEKKS